ncbi:MAG: cell division protein FtsZ [Dysgonamonadaceae bacterium]|jgi:cell division protein FtsZ|nr:cell division protein FtsZ [Dysgonamonadaceae bacterium]
MDDSLLKFDYDPARSSIIKVIGVGGGGGNAVNHMYKQGIRDVSFLLCNTDYQALYGNDVPCKLQLGKTVTEGLGAGNNPEKAKEAALESVEDIRRVLSDGTKMAFITAGMGGGTGTGAAPVIAKVALESGILTVGIVTIPFLFEGERKILQALYGVEEMSRHVDALLVVNNERLREIYQDLTMLNAFARADDTLAIAAKSIAEIITIPGHINLDFADVRTILKDGGVAIMSTGTGSGEGRVGKAIDNALNSPLLNNNSVFRAKKVLLNISFSEKIPLMMEEMNDVNDFMSRFGRGVESFIWGAAIESELEEQVKVTLLATGFGMDDIPMMIEKREIEKETLSGENRQKWEEEQERLDAEARKAEELIKRYYGDEGYQKIGTKTRPKPFIFTIDQLDSNPVIDLVINQPAYKRDPKLLEVAEPAAASRPETLG